MRAERRREEEWDRRDERGERPPASPGWGTWSFIDLEEWRSHQYQGDRAPGTSSLEFLCLLQPSPPPAATDTPYTHTCLNSALHVFELNAICHFTREHHGTLFIAFSLRFGSPESLFFPYQFASSPFTIFSASLWSSGRCHCDHGLSTPENRH